MTAVSLERLQSVWGHCSWSHTLDLVTLAPSDLWTSGPWDLGTLGPWDLHWHW